MAVGWWPSFAGPAGAYAKMDGDGKVQLITGAQECGTGAVMTLRNIAADELGIDPTRHRVDLPRHLRRAGRPRGHRIAGPC